MQFDLPKEKSSIIKVIGVGGGGSNAINYMYKQGIKGVNFVICNTDQQALEISPVQNKIQLGPHLTEGRGAGSHPDVGRQATEESLEEIKEILEVNTKMIFITAGMGGGTGTGGAPIIARAAREMGILTVGIVTEPFVFEGRRRKQQAQEGIAALKENVDTLIVISNDKLRQMFSNLTISRAFAEADNILATAAKGIAEIITVTGNVNVDFEDVKTVMTNSGVAIMGSASAAGEHRALQAVEAALSSPLLSDSDIRGAKHILLNITSGTDEVTMDELAQITDYVQEEAGHGTDVIWGNCTDESLDDRLSVTVIATGFEGKKEQKAPEVKTNDKRVTYLDENGDKVGIPGKSTRKIQQPDPEEKAGDKKYNQFSIEFDLQNQDTEEELTANEETMPEADTDEELNIISYRKDDHGSEIAGPEKDADISDQASENDENESTSHQRPVEYPASIHNPGLQRPELNRSQEDVLRNRERVQKLKGLSMKLKNPGTLKDYENEPAYKRRNIQLEDVPHSSEDPVSRYSLQQKKDQEEDRFELRKNNSFLHDNVD